MPQEVQQFAGRQIRTYWDDNEEKYYFCIVDAVEALTDIIYQTWAGLTAREYKHLKGLHKENLRDNMTNSVARVACEAFEQQTGKKVVSELSMKRFLESQQPQLNFPEGTDDEKK